MDAHFRSLIRSYLSDPRDAIALQILRAAIQSSDEALTLPLARHAVQKLLEDQNVPSMVVIPEGKSPIYPITAAEINRILLAIDAKQIIVTKLVDFWGSVEEGSGTVSFIINPESNAEHFLLDLLYFGETTLEAFDHAHESQRLKDQAFGALETWAEIMRDHSANDLGISLDYRQMACLNYQQNCGVQVVDGRFTALLWNGRPPIEVRFDAVCNEDDTLTLTDRQFIYRNLPGVEPTNVGIASPEP